MTTYGPVVTSLAGAPIPVSDTDRRRALWLIRRYTSLTYIRRMSAIFANFLAGYEDFSKRSPTGVDFHRENLTRFFQCRAAIASGLDEVARGYTHGYASIRTGCEFDEFLGGRRFEFGIENEEIGWDYHGRHKGLYAWVEVARKMAHRSRTTLDAAWAFPEILIAAEEGPEAPADTELPIIMTRAAIKTGEDIPAAGFWMPSTIPTPCPNYLLVAKAPRAAFASERLDYPPFPDGAVVRPARTLYQYDKTDTTWDLIRVDRRYEGGRAPAAEEEAFIGAENEPPPWPPEQPAVRPPSP